MIEIAFQVASGVAAIGRVATNSYVVSRALGAAALGTIAADYATKCLLHGADAVYVVGLAMYAIPTGRNLLILLVPRLDSDRKLRGIACAIAFLVWSGIAITADVVNAVAPLDLMTIIPFLGFGLASIGEVSNHMSTRRYFILTIGCLMSVFAIETQAWGLLVKALISDVVCSIFYILKDNLVKLAAS